MRGLARFIDRHVTRFRPITCRDFEMRYNEVKYKPSRWKQHCPFVNICIYLHMCVCVSEQPNTWNNSRIIRC